MDKVNIVDAIEDKDLFRPLFKDLSTWSAWLTFLKALYGLKMKPKEYELYQKCTDRKTVPKRGFKEAYAMCGRRGGKSYIAALLAVYSALFGDFEKHLSPGEVGWVFCIATDKRQARIVLDYVKAFLELFPDIISDSLTWEVRPKNKINIAVRPANFRAGRGYTTICIIIDEVAHLRDENSANPCEEIINSLLPGLLTDGLLIGISTVYARFGYLFNVHKEYFGDENSDVLIWQSDTLNMNPTYDQKKIDRMMKRDKIAALAEYYSVFREDVESFLPESLVNEAMEDYQFRPPMKGITYSAFTDSSGGRQDSFTLGIAHEEDGIVIVDRIEEYKPPFNPEIVVKDFVEIIFLV